MSRRSLVGALTGAALGAAASLGIDQFLRMPAFLLVTLPGSILLGALLGWTIGRIGRHRLPIAIGLAFAATAANVPLSGFVDWAMRDPLGMGHDGGSLAGCLGISFLGVVILWWALIPVAVVAGSLLTLVTGFVPAKKSP